jgi:hypothetical protein
MTPAWGANGLRTRSAPVVSRSLLVEPPPNDLPHLVLSVRQPCAALSSSARGLPLIVVGVLITGWPDRLITSVTEVILLVGSCRWRGPAC